MADQQRRTGDRGPGASDHRGTTLTAGSFAGLGLQFALTILAFLYIGNWLDRKLGTAPWLLLLGVFIGAAGGFYSLYRALTASRRREQRDPRER
jgi:F0F1-type ATP synthase assembly protein I